MGGEYCCDVCPFGLTCATDGRSPGCAVLVGIVVRYTFLYINGGIWGPLLLMFFNGPTPAM